MLDFLSLPAVTEDELTRDPDAVLERVDRSEGPFLIFCNSGSNLLLFD